MNKNENDNKTNRLTMWGCLQATLEDYGICANVFPKVGQHIVDDFFKLLIENGYAEKKVEEVTMTDCTRSTTCYDCTNESVGITKNA